MQDLNMTSANEVRNECQLLHSTNKSRYSLLSDTQTHTHIYEEHNTQSDSHIHKLFNTQAIKRQQKGKNK